MTKNIKNKVFGSGILCLSFFLVSFGLLFNVGTVEAADPKPTIRDEAYSARYVSQSIPDPITIEAGQTVWLKFNFKNTGTATWDNAGSNYISAYTMEPRYHNSLFFGTGWYNPSQIGRMAGVIKPGEIGEYGIPLTAPDKIGQYREEFYLASENYSWVKGGYFYVDVKVVPKTAVAPVVNIPKEEKSVATNTTQESYEGALLVLNRNSVEAIGGEKIKMILGYQNLGTATWKNFKISADNPTSLAVTSEKFTLADIDWESGTVIMTGEKEVVPSGFLREIFYFRTPTKVGDYTARFTVSVDGHNLETLSIPVSVTSNAPSHYQAPEFDLDEDVVTSWLDYEPRIRVGLWEPDSEVQVVSYLDDYFVFSGIEKKGVLTKERVGHLTYKDGIYKFVGDGLEFDSTEYIRLAPANDPHAVVTLYNYSRVVSWKGGANFNEYRGAIEYRIGEKSPDLWVVNDLLMSDYMRGIAENSNSSPIEYLRAQAVAQRTYAYFVKESDKYGIFDVVATTGDQLYLGYKSEAQLSRFVGATEDTRGYMATYEGKVIITPYFAHTDGRTRSWTEVWGGSAKPWLVSVPAEYDNGRGLYGHGVGMSQLDAAARAEAEGLTWEEIIKYYYTGVEVEKIYD